MKVIFEKGRDVFPGHAFLRRLLLFERPAVDRAVNLSKVADAGIQARQISRANEIRTANQCKEGAQENHHNDDSPAEGGFLSRWVHDVNEPQKSAAVAVDKLKTSRRQRVARD